MPQGQRGFELIIEVDLPRYETISVPSTPLNGSVQITAVEQTQTKVIMETRYLHLDVISERSITSDATLASQPIYDGSTLIDHMYVNPDKYTVSGIFSIYGNYYNDSYAYVPGTVENGDRLTNIQKTFEYIKQNGILCNLSTYIAGSKGSPRFKTRNRMAIESITWNESESSMKYSITFKEVKEVIFDSAVVIADTNITALNLPKAISLGDILFKEMTTNTNSTTLTMWDRILLGCMVTSGIYLTKGTAILARKHLTVSNQNYRDIFNEIKNYADDFLPEIVKGANNVTTDEVNYDSATGAALGAKWGASAGVTVGSVVLAVGAKSIATTGFIAAGGATSAGPVGLIVAACILVGTAIGLIISNISSKKKIKNKRFKILDNINWDIDYQDKKITFSGSDLASVSSVEGASLAIENSINITSPSETESILLLNPKTSPNTNELERLKNFLNSANTVLNQLSNNTKFYTISTNYDTNENVECVLNIGGMNYKIVFNNVIDETYYKVIDSKTNLIKIVKAGDGIGGKVLKTYKINKVLASVKVYNNFSEWEILDGINGVADKVDEATVTCLTLDQMDSSCTIFRDASQLYYVYLYNPWFEPETLNILLGNADLEQRVEYLEKYSGIANCYLVQSYGTVVSVKDKLISKLEDILGKAEV